MSDAFAAAVDEEAEAAPVAAAEPQAAIMPAEAATPAAPTYPPFHPSEYRDNPLAIMINNLADTVCNVPKGTASKNDLGEAYVYCVTCYTKGSGDMPPWAIAVFATVNFVIAVFVAKRASSTASAGDAERREAEEDARRAKKKGGAPSSPLARFGRSQEPGAFDGVVWAGAGGPS